jgi:hypothetical protein
MRSHHGQPRYTMLCSCGDFSSVAASENLVAGVAAWKNSLFMTIARHDVVAGGQINSSTLSARQDDSSFMAVARQDVLAGESID